MLNQKFNSFYGTVTIEDKGHNDHWYAIVDETGARVHGKVENGEFLILVPTEQVVVPVVLGPPVIVRTTSMEPLPPYEYVVERVCGGDAAGGGCGAPLGVSVVSKRHFDAEKGGVYSDFVEHNDNEVGASMLAIRERGYMWLKLHFGPCNSCRDC